MSRNVISKETYFYNFKISYIHNFIFVIMLVLFLSSNVFASGWIKNESGNWLYEENGVFVKNTTKVIDGVEYYFNSNGIWVPWELMQKVKLVNREMVTFTMEGKDYNDRKYKTKFNVVMPILGGENSVAINEFIRKEFVNVIKKYYEDYRLSILFLQPEIELKEMLEGKNERGVISFGYFGGGMFNLYINTRKMEMWAMPNNI